MKIFLPLLSVLISFSYSQQPTQVVKTYENGEKWSEGTLKDGRMISRTEWSWFENGQKMSEGTFKDGKEDGLVTEWYENGQKETEWT